MKIEHGLPTFDGERYRYVYVDGKKVPEHVYLWEQLNGPKPKGCDIHHIDGDGKNNDTDNIVCMTKSDHKMLHAKLKLEGRDVVDDTDPAIIASRKRHNDLAKAHRQAHLEEERARDRAEYQLNRDRKRERNREFYQRHREELRAQQAEYEKAHKAERAARNVKYKELHGEERKQYYREYHAAHKEEVAARKREYLHGRGKEIVKAYRAAYKEVHAAEERYRRAVKRGDSAEKVAQLKEALEKSREEFKQKKERV